MAELRSVLGGKIRLLTTEILKTVNGIDAALAEIKKIMLDSELVGV